MLQVRLDDETKTNVTAVLDAIGLTASDAVRLLYTRLIANDAPLGPEWFDHPLKVEWSGTCECHIGGDFLLIYRLDDEDGKGGAIAFVRAGTHAELFRE